MKKKYVLLALICVFLLTGCGSKYKDECFKKAKEMYADINDSSITSCVVEYVVERQETLHAYCINDEETIFLGKNSIFRKEDQYYDTYKSFYDQTKAEVTTPVEGYYTYEFKASELK